jgi:hypothetical protein
VEQCIERYEPLVRKAFVPRQSLHIPVLSPLVDFCISFIADGRYPVANLEAALQEAFGNDRSIIDCSKATATGIRFGIPVTTIRDTATCVFTNYNGVGTRPQGCGKDDCAPVSSLSTYSHRISHAASERRPRTHSAVGGVSVPSLFPFP